MDVHNLAFGQSRFSAVRLMEVLEHPPNPLPVFRAIRDLAVPDGVLVITVPDMDGLIQLIAQILDRYGWRLSLMRLYQAHCVGPNPRALVIAV